MLSYPIDEAEELLEGKLSTATQTLSNCEEDLDFLREQITVSSLVLICLFLSFLSSVFTLYINNLERILIDTLQTMEVALARVYNWDVVQKRKEKADEEKSKGKGKGKEAA